MAKLILDKNTEFEIEVEVQNFFEGGETFNASGSGEIPEEVGELIKGKSISTYEAEFSSGKSYPIFGDYNFAKAQTNGSEGAEEYEGFSIILEKRD